MSNFITARLITEGNLLNGGRVESDIRRVVKRQLLLASDFYVNEVKKKTPVGAFGNLAGSWDYKYDDGDQTATIAAGAKYASNVEFGRKPGKGIPSGPLTMWAKSKFGVDEKKAKSIAFLISRKAKRKGIKGQFFATKTFDSNLAAINANFIGPIGTLVVQALGG